MEMNPKKVMFLALLALFVITTSLITFSINSYNSGKDNQVIIAQYKQEIQAKDTRIAELEKKIVEIQKQLEDGKKESERALKNLKEAAENAKNVKPSGKGFTPTPQW